MTIVLSLSRNSFSLAKHLSWKCWSPTANISSISNISASTLIATEKAKRIYIPDEYVLTGLSINEPNSENSIISSILFSISVLVNPKIEALKYIFSLPVKSGWNPAPSSNNDVSFPAVSRVPLVGYKILVINFKRVDFPLPFVPTKAIVSPFFISKFISFKTWCHCGFSLFQKTNLSFNVAGLSNTSLKSLLIFLTSIAFSIFSMLSTFINIY